MAIWVGDGLVPEGDATVSAFDHGLTVGDGVFETLKVIDGTPFALSRHLARLARSAAGLGLPAPDDTLVRRACAAVCAAAGPGRHRLRITWTGGVASLGSERAAAPGTLLVASAPAPRWGPSAAVAVVPWARNERSATAGLKTTSYAENVVALAHAHRLDADEAIFADSRGRLSEGTGSNVLLVLDDRLVTPGLDTGCLAGITRALVLEWCGAAEVEVTVEAALGRASEVFLTSSTRDVQPVHAIDGTTLQGVPGPHSRRVAAELVRREALDVDP